MTTENLQDAPLPASDKQEGMEESGPLSYEELLAQRTEQIRSQIKPPAPLPEVETPEEETEQTTEDETEELSEDAGESEEESEVTETEEEDVLSQFNLDEWSEEDLEALGNAIRSKVPKRFGELTARAKQAEERLQKLEAKLAEKNEKNPLEVEDEVENNPFADIATVEGLQEEVKRYTAVIEWADDLLDENDDASADDVITTQDGKDITKREVKQYLKNARKAKEKFIPAQYAVIQKAENAKRVHAALEQKAKAELPWYGDTDTEVRREYDMVLQDKTVQKIRERVPEIAPNLDYLLAHAVNSMSQVMKAQKNPKKASPKLTPPSNPAENASRGSDAGSVKINKTLKEVQDRFQQTQSVEDLIALRTLQRSRKT